MHLRSFKNVKRKFSLPLNPTKYIICGMVGVDIKGACIGLVDKDPITLPSGNYRLNFTGEEESCSMICPAGGMRVYATRLTDNTAEVDCIASCKYVREFFRIRVQLYTFPSNERC